MPPTYASAEQLANYIVDDPEVVLPADADAVERLLERAELQVDQYVIGGPLSPDAALRLDPADLTASQAAALSRSVCAQAAHRLRLGEPFYSEPEDVATGDIRVLRPAQAVAIRAFEEAAGHGLIQRSGTVHTPPETTV
jgi:hypothetical protein